LKLYRLELSQIITKHRCMENWEHGYKRCVEDCQVM